MLAWDALGELDAYRITEIPRRPDPGPAQPPGESDDAGRTQRLAALVAAYHAGALLATSPPGGDPPVTPRTGGLPAPPYPPGPPGAGVDCSGSGTLAIGWVRHDTDGPVQFLAAGP